MKCAKEFIELLRNLRRSLQGLHINGLERCIVDAKWRLLTLMKALIPWRDEGAVSREPSPLCYVKR